MTLTIIPSSDTPGRIDISGENMDFIVTSYGGRIDITSENDSVDVWMNDGVANIRWSKKADIWSSTQWKTSTQNSLWQPLHMPFEKDHSMKNTTALDAHLIFSDSETINPYGGFGFSGNYFFHLTDEGVGGNTLVRRFNMTTFDFSDLTIIRTTFSAICMVVYDDNIVYVVGYGVDWESIDIYKANFDADTFEKVGEFALSTTYEGHDFAGSVSGICSRCKYGLIDCLVYIHVFYYSGEYWDDHGEIVSICTFNLTTDSKINQVFSDGGLNVWDFQDNYYYGIHQYHDKAVFSLEVSDWADSEFEGEMCGNPFWVVNLNNGSVNRIDDHVYDTDEFYEINNITNSAMDNENGIYYWGVNASLINTWRVRKASISSFTPSAGYASAEIEGIITRVLGGDNQVFIEGFSAIESTRDLLSTALSSIIPDLEIKLGSNYYTSSKLIIDKDNEIAWGMKTDYSELYGFHLDNGVDRELIINWGESEPPEGSYCYLLMPFNGYAFALFRLSDNPTYAHYGYILEPS